MTWERLSHTAASGDRHGSIASVTFAASAFILPRTSSISVQSFSDSALDSRRPFSTIGASASSSVMSMNDSLKRFT